MKLSPGLEGKTVAVQGFGNVGFHAAKFLHEQDGCKIVGVSEWDGSITDPRGLDPEKVAAYREEKGTIRGYPGAKTVDDPAAVLETPCDILIPAALENQINLTNAKKLKCRMIAEAANGPTTPGAEAILLKKNIFILPDIYLNAGGVVVSYFEWSKNLAHMRYGRMEKRLEEAANNRLIEGIENMIDRRFDDSVRHLLVRGADEELLVNSGLEEAMITAYQEVRDVFWRRKSVNDMRTAAYVVAIKKVAASYRALGIFP